MNSLHNLEQNRRGKILDITVPEPILITNGMNVEEFIAQFQLHCKTLIAVVDKQEIMFYKDLRTIPTNLEFIGKKRGLRLSQYYFLQKDENKTYCVYGKAAAKIFYPKIDTIAKSHSYFSEENTGTANVVLIDKGKIYTFPVVEDTVIVKEINKG